MSTLSTSSLVSSPRIKCDSLTMLPSNSCAHSPISPSSKLMAMPITKILPFLYLGSSIDACDSEKLKSLHITHVLNVSINLPDPPETLKLKGYKRIPVIDSFTQDIMPHFEEAFNFIEEARKSGGNILIHCQAGVSRSASFTIGYLIRYYNMSFEDALNFVQARRTRVAPNFGFLGQLLLLSEMVREGSWPVLRSAAVNNASPSSSRSGFNDDEANSSSNHH